MGPVSASLWVILERAWQRGIEVQSDIARSYSDYVALAASAGWISTVAPDGLTHSRTWRITASGLTALQTRGN